MPEPRFLAERGETIIPMGSSFRFFFFEAEEGWEFEVTFNSLSPPFLGLLDCFPMIGAVEDLYAFLPGRRAFEVPVAPLILGGGRLIVFHKELTFGPNFVRINRGRLSVRCGYILNTVKYGLSSFSFIKKRAYERCI